MIRTFFIICLVAGSIGGQAIACEFQDTGTETSVFVNFNDIESDLDVHIRKGGTLMTGVHVEENRFLCDDSIGFMGSAYASSDLEPNYALDRHVRYISHAMAACPPPTAMVGLNTSKNVLLCAPCPALVAMQDLFVDTDTEREGMHACPEDSVMVGILPGNDLLLCARIR